MVTVIESDVLKQPAKTGKMKYWQCIVFEENGAFYYKKRHWQEDSKVQESTPVHVIGKNIGKANETSDKSQAIAEFDSIIRHQRDRGYSEDGSTDHIPTKPMLANKFKDKKKHVTYPCFVQPKLDGFRMLKEADGTEAWTRGGKPHVQQCVQHLMWDTGDTMVDGELILPPFEDGGKQKFQPLQRTASAAKKFHSGVSDTLLYCVYDVVEPNMPFAERTALLQELAMEAPDQVVVVETIEVNSEEEMLAAHAHFTAQGYEGTIIRSGPDGYLVGHRSNSLLKLKDFIDGEYKIIGAKDGKGSHEGKCCFLCVTDEGKEFDVVPEGTMEYRAHLWDTRDEHIGKWLTVRHYAFTNDGKPFHATGIDFREEDEF